MHNSEGSKMFGNVEGETRDGEKVSPDAVVFESGASDYYQTQEKIQASKERSEASKAEREKELRSFWRKVGAMAALAATTAAIAFGAGAKESQPLPKEQYEEKIGDFLANKENSNIIYGEDGTVTVTYEQAWRDGTMDKYRLEDANGDALYESGAMTEKNGSRSATFESEQGLDIASADATLRANFAQNNAN